jgi:hypothetical protein
VGATLYVGLAAAVWVIALFLGMAAAMLCVRRESPPRIAAAAAAPDPARAAMVVGFDPETGGLAPPSAQALARLGKAPPAAAARSAPVFHPDGSISMDVRSWLREYSVITQDPRGRLLHGCVSGKDEADRARTAPPPVGLEEK